MTFSTILKHRPKRLCLLLSLLGALILASPLAQAKTTVNTIRASAGNDTMRLVFELSSSSTYKELRLNNPPRLVLDIPGGEWRTTTPKLDERIIKAIRHQKRKDGVLRVVLDMAKDYPTHTFSLKPFARYGHRLVVDIGRKGTPLANSVSGGIKPGKFIKQLTTKPPKRKTLVIVIDPGHGGKDPGAVGRRKTKEKKVVLSISKYLQSYLNARPGYKAILTRKGDYYISLRQRLRIARKNKADLFVAIHADAFKHSRAYGASVFALSERGASSEAARWLAQKENYSELGGIDLDNKGSLLRSVLIDLSQTATIGASLELGDAILKEMGRFAKLHKGRVEQARFVVLKSPDIPSILVETGFLSNYTEEGRLRTTKYQKKMAYALMKGIDKYFHKRPPENFQWPNKSTQTT